VRFDEASALRAEVVGSEYLGHSQIVTVTTAVGSTLRAKLGAQVKAQRGDRSGSRSTPVRCRCSTHRAVAR
jgi:multiple sugar transport system ATP-binding protein